MGALYDIIKRFEGSKVGIGSKQVWEGLTTILNPNEGIVGETYEEMADGSEEDKKRIEALEFEEKKTRQQLIDMVQAEPAENEDENSKLENITAMMPEVVKNVENKSRIIDEEEQEREK